MQAVILAAGRGTRLPDPAKSGASARSVRLPTRWDRRHWPSMSVEDLVKHHGISEQIRVRSVCRDGPGQILRGRDVLLHDVAVEQAHTDLVPVNRIHGELNGPVVAWQLGLGGAEPIQLNQRHVVTMPEASPAEHGLL